MLRSTTVVLALLVPMYSALAADPAGADASPGSSETKTLQIPTQSGVDSSKAGAALEQGRAAKRRGDLLAAIRAYQEVYQYAARDSYMHKEAKDELQFHLPLMRVQQVMLLGDRKEAETIVKRLLEFHSKDAKRQQVLRGVLAKVQDPNFQPRPRKPEAAPEEVMEAVQRALDDYRREHDEYPRGYDELNKLLPANKPPLDSFDITSYYRNGAGFRLELRAKKPPHNTYKLEKTGLLR